MKLKPCPFCGRSATVYMQQSFIKESYIIECDNYKCGCTYGGNMSLTQQQVIRRWNKRGDKE